jgi:NADH-quinone oxidoreductase subunit K
MVVMLLCIELMFFSISLHFVFISVCMFNNIGQIFCLLIITTAASETAIGVSLLIIALRLGNKINYQSLVQLRG